MTENELFIAGFGIASIIWVTIGLFYMRKKELDCIDCIAFRHYVRERIDREQARVEALGK